MQHVLTFIFLSFFAIPSGFSPSDEYTYKVKNLKPRDYGIDVGTWEKAISILKKKLDANDQDIDALYLRAIAYREMGIRRALVLRTRDWKKSTEDFEEVLARDSTHHDVLFQYGLLKQYKKEFDDAFRLMHRQQSVANAQGYIEAALFRMYRYLFAEHPPADIEAWFRLNTSDYAHYFRAEEIRREGRLMVADNLFESQLQRELQIPVQPVLLSRARIYYALNQPEKAQGFVYQAIDEIEDEIGARLFFEDFKYILSDQEIERYTTLHASTDFRRFFYSILEKRNPTRADRVDLRLQVHYNRLLEVEKMYTQYAPREAFRVIKKSGRNHTADRDFPRAYWLNGELGDRGLIFMRHGTPDDIAASATEGTEFLESWKYVNPDLVFHFEGHSGLGVLIPLLPNELSVLESREIWGGGYALLSQSIRRKRDAGQSGGRRSYDLDIIEFNNELFDQAIEDVSTGLTTDRYVWPGDLKHMDIPYLVSSFRTDENKTLVEVHFAVPVGAVLSGTNEFPERILLDVGFAVHDTLWNALHKKQTPRSVPSGQYSPEESAIDLVRFVAPPDSYQVNLHVGIQEVRRKGSYLFGYRVPDYTSDTLMVSDIVPAFSISISGQGGRYVKNGLEIRANPGRGFLKDKPLAIYYEVYNLTYGADDQTAYSIRYTMEERKNRRRKRRKSSAALSVTIERQGAARKAIEYGELDVSSLKRGAYDLRVTITDLHTGHRATNYREVELR